MVPSLYDFCSLDLSMQWNTKLILDKQNYIHQNIVYNTVKIDLNNVLFKFGYEHTNNGNGIV